MRIEGALQRQYALPSLAAFTASPTTRALVTGKVVKAQPVPPDDSVATSTLVSIAIDASTDPSLVGRTVVVRDLGGVIPLRSVRAEFEAKTGRTLTDKELDAMVDYRVAGQAHVAVGEVAALWIAVPDSPEATTGAVSDVAARMRLNVENGLYEWYGPLLNPVWPKTVSVDEMVKLLRIEPVLLR